LLLFAFDSVFDKHFFIHGCTSCTGFNERLMNEWIHKVVAVRYEETGDLGKYSRILLNVIWKKEDMSLGMWSNWLWFWLLFIGMLLWWLIFGFLVMCGISFVSRQLFI
jgi:hypothetical protein